jgi:cytochrome c oxidase accessory protein FixG
VPKEVDFRDKIATVDQTGKRKWLRPKQVSGTWYRWRRMVSYLLLIILIGTPFIKVDGHPFMLFNIIDRKFILFGVPYWPQDSEIFAIGLLIIFVFIILFTAVFGRLWCGWACPQTVFMEMVFRRLEFWIEGDPVQQRKLDNMPWNGEKVIKRGGKHILFYAIAFFIGNIFLAYIIGVDALWEIITDPPAEHLSGLAAMALFSFVFYWVYAFFREQVCTLVCPYGRLQSVLLDKNSIVVSYDHVRGEPRRKYNPNADMNKTGDCIDCRQCVKVCPTGIDIRHGTQLECINCTACMDACDTMMSGVKRPKGLIRYASFNSIENGVKKLINGRSIAYTLVLFLLVTVFSLLMNNRTDTETTILRAAGTLPIKLDDGSIRNLFSLKIINKTFNDVQVRIELEEPNGSSRMVTGQWLKVAAGEAAESALLVDLPRSILNEAKTPVRFRVFNDDEVFEHVSSTFLAPPDIINRNR